MIKHKIGDGTRLGYQDDPLPTISSIFPSMVEFININIVHLMVVLIESCPQSSLPWLPMTRLAGCGNISILWRDPSGEMILHNLISSTSDIICIISFPATLITSSVGIIINIINNNSPEISGSFEGTAPLSRHLRGQLGPHTLTPLSRQGDTPLVFYNCIKLPGCDMIPCHRVSPVSNTCHGRQAFKSNTNSLCWGSFTFERDRRSAFKLIEKQ